MIARKILEDEKIHKENTMGEAAMVLTCYGKEEEILAIDMKGRQKGQSVKGRQKSQSVSHWITL